MIGFGFAVAVSKAEESDDSQEECQTLGDIWHGDTNDDLLMKWQCIYLRDAAVYQRRTARATEEGVKLLQSIDNRLAGVAGDVDSIADSVETMPQDMTRAAAKAMREMRDELWA